MYIRYVCGFLFNEDLSRVVLIQKNRPDWQKGLFNGVGGKVEPNESFDNAMIREFEEETGVTVKEWTYLATCDSDEYKVCFYYSVGDISKVTSTTDEEIFTPEYSNIGALPLFRNLSWIIPMARYRALNPGETYWI